MQSAQTAESEALADIASAENAAQSTPLKGAALESFISNYTKADAESALTSSETAVGAAQAALLTAEATLVSARNAVGDNTTVTSGDYLDGVRLTDANLTKALNQVKADIAATAGTATDESASLNARTAAQAELNSDIGANGTNTEILQDLRSAIVAYAEAGGDLDATVEATTSVADLLALINTALSTDATAGNTNATDTLVATFDTAGTPLYTFGIATEEEKAISDAIDVVTGRDVLTEAVDTAQAVLIGNPLGQDLADIETLIATREGLKDAVATAQEELTEAQAYFAELSTLVDAYNAASDDVADALEALEALGVENLIELGATSTAGTAGEADLYLFNLEGTGNISLLNFEGDDMLFLGNDYVRFDLNPGTNVAGERLGDSSKMEVFFLQSGTNTILSIETEAFGGNALSLDDVTQITLIGVNAEDLQFVDGYVTLA